MSSILSLHRSSPAFLLALLPVILAVTLGFAARWPSLEVGGQVPADELVALVQSTGVVSVKHFGFCWLLLLNLVQFSVYATFVSGVREGGYDNINPRSQLKPELGWLYRLKCALDNLQENFVLLTMAVLVSDKFSTGEEMDAMTDKMAILFMLARTIYPFMYIFELDLLRTTSFMISWAACVCMIVPPLFPAAMKFIG